MNSRVKADGNNKLIVKKGIEYSVEFIEGRIHINLSYTNLCRTTKPVIELKLQNPIDHKKHKLINIKTGKSLSHEVKTISEIKDSENIFETFDTAQAFEERFGNIRFSQEKFYFEQTNLRETIELINELQANYSNITSLVNFTNLNQIPYSANIILNSKKFVFANGKIHYTPVEGLINSGLLQMPITFPIKLIISTAIVFREGIEKILDNVNARLFFIQREYFATYERRCYFIRL
ncbi:MULTISPECIES: hypothetical protein [Cyanophyceae]|uniref:hypothetical protein n=1 Tax=Cyanophyceae TaxID=3028117 RepID=UPI001684A488|nr:hypothetical protein [Trichocoleus sp. FACHB-40]MBD2002937.1 hypothetical protein [Trichocoleus sp. FACHB-40]